MRVGLEASVTVPFTSETVRGNAPLAARGSAICAFRGVRAAPNPEGVGTAGVAAETPGSAVGLAREMTAEGLGTGLAALCATGDAVGGETGDAQPASGRTTAATRSRRRDITERTSEGAQPVAASPEQE
jgi:hypothetical protein